MNLRLLLLLFSILITIVQHQPWAADASVPTQSNHEQQKSEPVIPAPPIPFVQNTASNPDFPELIQTDASVLNEYNQKIVELHSVPKVSKAERCHNLIPGLTRMLMGIDITTLDLMPPNIKAQMGLRSALFEFSCADSTVYHSHSGVNYTVADQISIVIPMDLGTEAEIVDIYRTASGVHSSYALQMSNGMSLPMGSFSASVEYKHTKDMMNSKNVTVAVTNAAIGVMQVMLRDKDNLKIHPDFLKRVANIPLANYNNETAKYYRELIHDFGSHYFSIGLFGGFLQQKTLINQSFALRSSSDSLSMNVQMNFFNAVASRGFSYEHSKVMKNFSEHSQSVFKYFGGYTHQHLSDSGGYQEWKSSLEASPWLYGGQLSPISELIPGPKGNYYGWEVVYKRLGLYLIDYVTTLAHTCEDLQNHTYNDLLSWAHMLNRRDLGKDHSEMLKLPHKLHLKFNHLNNLLGWQNLADGNPDKNTTESAELAYWKFIKQYCYFFLEPEKGKKPILDIVNALPEW